MLQSMESQRVGHDLVAEQQRKHTDTDTHGTQRVTSHPHTDPGGQVLVLTSYRGQR